MGAVGLLVAVALALACLVASGRESFAEQKSAMVIVEPRKHARLRPTIENFDKNMPPHYDLYIFHGKSAAAYARRAAANVSRRRKVHYVRLDTDNLTVDGYNALLKSPREFWDKIDAENVLVFQTDTALCSASRNRVQDFEHLGYIGCSYDGTAGKGAAMFGDHAFWGVGGLSFRKKSAALECLAKVPHAATMPEDVFFSDCVEAGIGARPANGAQLSEFCTQNTFLARSFGAHRLELMEDPRKPAFLEYCPEASGIA